MDLRDAIRTIPDHPKPGILFRDITTLLGDATALRQSVAELAGLFPSDQIDHVAGIEARGFILGGAAACQLGVGFIPVRKRGKLPHRTLIEEYELEYGEDAVEIHIDAAASGQRVLIIDDLIATGGTATAAINLIRKAGADVVGAAFVVDLPDLGGAAKIRDLGVPVASLVAFPGH